jgi:hypothetical protein
MDGPMPPGAPEITVVIPVFNEEGIVATACRDLMKELPGCVTFARANPTTAWR